MTFTGLEAHRTLTLRQGSEVILVITCSHLPSFLSVCYISVCLHLSLLKSPKQLCFLLWPAWLTALRILKPPSPALSHSVHWMQEKPWLRHVSTTGCSSLVALEHVSMASCHLITAPRFPASANSRMLQSLCPVVCTICNTSQPVRSMQCLCTPSHRALVLSLELLGPHAAVLRPGSHK